MKLASKVLVITGGGNGIGRELVLQALARGARVAAVDMRAESLAQLTATAGAGDRLSTHALDITDRAAVEALPAQVIATHGVVDGLINNAGIIQPFAHIRALERAVIDRVLRVNLDGTLNMMLSFLPILVARPEAHLANVASMGAFLPVPGQALYCATKAAVRLLTEGLYAELMETNVRVSVIMPGATGTEISTNSGVETPTIAGTKAHRTTTPAAAARTILDGIERNKLHILVGWDARLVSWAMRVAPVRTLHAIQRQMKSLLEPSPATPR